MDTNNANDDSKNQDNTNLALWGGALSASGASKLNGASGTNIKNNANIKSCINIESNAKNKFKFKKG